MPIQNKYLIENKKPIELVQELEKYEIKKSPLSPAARGKVVNKSGSDYLSENKDYYGPGNGQSSPFSSPFSPFPSSSSGGSSIPNDYPSEIRRYERQQRERHRNEEINRATLFLVETTAKAAAASALTTATGGLAPIIGGGVWIGGKWLESRNNEFLQFLGKKVGDLGSGMFSGGLFANSTVGEFARKSGVDLKKLENLFEAKGYVETSWAIEKHSRHKDEGKSYKSDCELCNL